MKKRIGIIGIVVEDMESVEALNTLLHEYGRFIIGRMGIPFREKQVSVISVAVFADNDTISALSGKLGRIRGVNAKVTYSSTVFDE